jgi:hypothetical protein
MVHFSNLDNFGMAFLSCGPESETTQNSMKVPIQVKPPKLETQKC